MPTLDPQTVRKNLLQGFYDANAHTDHATLKPQGKEGLAWEVGWGVKHGGR